MKPLGSTTQNVLRMPGVHCALYAAGHCTYEERLNPGYEGEWRCAELLRFMAMYDALLEQADRFSLTEDEVTSLWEKRVAATRAPGEGCSAYAPRSSGCPGCRKPSGACASDRSAGKAHEAPSVSAECVGQEEVVCAFPVQDFSSVLDCVHGLGSACILLMPRCDGVCGRFIHRSG
ncbi:hypothetical protein N1030_04005 [Desulfovibrio mangrovi]|uniref:hypothetical protein n=1 Tax=Desulfovibrio mangrovi TaxID=2976983 RepID=UPI0022472C49|nr:hypothetical protein [Desulfovibrio mangrovi]UZP68149.1 hypothetical protein N1030_04005 [Desulfovibrio mangrovi]